MKRKVLGALCAIGAIALLAVLPSLASAGPATIEHDTFTIWFDGNGAPVAVPDQNIQVVYTNNANGSINVRAYGTLPEGAVLPTQAQQYNNANTGFDCGFGGTCTASQCEPNTRGVKTTTHPGMSIINLKTVQSLGLTLPRTVLFQADEVLQ